MENTYKAIWSEQDNEYVGQCYEWPSLSWLAPTKKEALEGIQRLVSEIKKDLQKEK